MPALHEQFPHWDIPLIQEKPVSPSGIIAADGETSSDLAVASRRKALRQHGIDRQSIDYVLLCTHTPDYPLPTTACLIQDRLKLPTRVGPWIST